MLPVDVSQRVVEPQMGTGWGDVCTGHMEPCEKAHQGGGAGQGIQLVASVVKTQSFQAIQSALIAIFLSSQSRRFFDLIRRSFVLACLFGVEL